MSRFAIAWLVWLAVIVGGFAVIEGMALASGTPSTLSDFVVWLSGVWGPLPFVLGVIVGGMAVHFWWHWRPAKADFPAKD